MPTWLKPRLVSEPSRPWPIWDGLRASAGPTPWSRWPPGVRRLRPTAAVPLLCSPSSSTTSSSGVGSASWHGVVLAPGSLVPWLTEAYVERVVFAPGRRVEVSEKARLFTGATRRGIELRDQECQHPLCEVRALWCQVDHIIPFAAGGPTTQENGRMLCGFHNRLRNGPAPPEAA